MLRSLAGGFRALLANPGLVLVVLLSNLTLALLLAVPLAAALHGSLVHTGASSTMMYGADWGWWSRFDVGLARGFTPDLLGAGFALRNLELLLRGTLPAGLFSGGSGAAPELLGVGAAYWLLQLLLSGGLLAVFRAPAGGWTFHGLVHGSGFYFGRLLRVGLLALAAAGLVFAAYAPLARWTDELAAEAVSERTALALLFARQALLLAALLAVHMVSSYAKVIVVCEERRSAALAVLSSAGFCLRNLPAALGQYVLVGAAGVLLLALFSAVDARVSVVGWRSQLMALAFFELFVLLRITLRLLLLISQLELQQAHGRPPA